MALVDRRAAIALAVLLGGCASWKSETRDTTRLEGEGRGDLGERLEISVEGATPEVATAIVDATRSELEGADLYDAVERAQGPAAPVASGTVARASRLELVVRESTSHMVHSGWHAFWRLLDEDGWVVRYEIDAVLLDRARTRVLEGHVTGLGWDEVSDLDDLEQKPAKKEDVALAALRDAAGKLGRTLRAAAETRARQAFDGLARIHLPPGVGPVPIAVLGFDDDPTARRRRGLALSRALAPALGRLGPDLSVVSSEEVESELGSDTRDTRRSFLALREEDLDRLVPRLGARLFVVGKLEGAGGHLSALARVIDAGLRVVGEVKAEAEGPGALKLLSVSLASELGKAIEKSPPTEKARREDD